MAPSSTQANIPTRSVSYSGSVVRRFHCNQTGRDFVVGDLHGAYDLLQSALASVGFCFGKDRLFCVGDLADRGRRSNDVLLFLDWLDAGGGGSVRGNHEVMLIDLYTGPTPASRDEHDVLRKNGMDWLLDLDLAQRVTIANAFAALPLAIEVETPCGTVGIVHADVPHRMTWGEFTDILKRKEKDGEFADIAEYALWSRLRIERGIRQPVVGIDAVFVGHSPVEEPITLGNVHFIDTGAAFGDLTQNPQCGVLTMVEITAIHPGEMASFSVAAHSQTFLSGRGDPPCRPSAGRNRANGNRRPH